MRTIIARSLCVLVLLTACSPSVSSADKNLAKSLDPKIDSMMNGFDSNNYEEFSRDLDERMRSGISKSIFEGDFHQTVINVIGQYKSRTLTQVSHPDKGVLVIYQAVFTKDSPVTLRVSFGPEQQRQVTGLYFQSEKLRAR